MRNVILAACFLALPGCMIFDNPFVGVWLVEVGQLSDPEQDSTITENFTDADPPEDGGTVAGDWVYTTEQEVSDSAAFVHVERAAGGELLMIVGDDVYPGTVEDGVATFSWTTFSDGTDREEHTPSGYFFEDTGRSETTVSYKLEKDKENGGLKGTVRVDTFIDVTYAETDEWDPYEVAKNYGSIPSFSFLEGTGNLNSALAAECQGQTCELSVETETRREGPLSATETRFDDDAYENLEDATQAGG